MISRVEDSADPRIAPYRLVADPHALGREGLFAAEGRLVAPQLLASRYRVHSVLVSDTALASITPALETRPDVDVFVAPAAVLSEIGGFDFHRGCLALGHRGERKSLEQIVAAPPPAQDLAPGARGPAPLLILEAVSNPDNVGGIFRSADAFGAAAVLLGPGCGDPLYRKAIRTSMGATLQVPWTELAEWPAALRAVRARGYHVIALTPGALSMPLRDAVAASAAPMAFLLGSEGFGLSRDAMNAASAIARIPMARGDSLNVATAAAIALYAASLA
ncbi:MAG: RNA methyltransferase [Acidobacteriota bacterium]|nr:RNA methyltransferase [Acidobacteriota bacterium]